MAQKNKLVALVVLLLVLSPLLACKAQDETPHLTKKDKSDFNNFRRQIMKLQEYVNEKNKIPRLKKQNNTTVKVIALVDSTSAENDDDNSQSLPLTGFIAQIMGNDTFNAYEIEYDRVAKKITSVKQTGEGMDPDVVEKKTYHKKSDDDDADEKPSHKKDKDDADDKPSHKKDKDDE
jgi:hypothetical protein